MKTPKDSNLLRNVYALLLLASLKRQYIYDQVQTYAVLSYDSKLAL